MDPDSASSAQRLIETLTAAPIVAILRARHARHLVAAAELIADAGIRAVEFPLTTPGALGALRTLRSRRPELLAGAGTVISPADVVAASNAGAQFLVAPCTRPDALTTAARCGLTMMPGAFTATEVAVAREHGAEVVKLFPATLGPGYVRALRDPFPGVRMVPTGGVGIEAIGEFLRAGAFAVGLGSPLVGDALDTGHLDGLADRVRRATAEVGR